MDRRMPALRTLLRKTYAEVTHDKEAWRRYLRFCARFYKYDFSDTVSIYAHNPDATACADYTTWNRLGRRIAAGEKGIPLIDRSLDSPAIRYVFDVSQTNARQDMPPVWQMKSDQDRKSVV